VSRNSTMYVNDMIDAANNVIEFSSELDRDALLADKKTRDATIRNLEVLGEAAKKVPAEITALDPEIPWRRITGLRDILAHDYFGIDNDILCDVIYVEVPHLLPRLLAIREKMESTTSGG
jgi:uncharacterized protein with HEPN domain